MAEQEKLKRQVRYRDSIYDILKDIALGGHNYLIIGKGSEARFYGIEFVEQRIEDGKIKYISPNINFQFNNTIRDFSRLQGQSLMNYIVNEITDNINDGKLASREDTIHYIDNVSKTIETSNDIEGFFKNNRSYSTEEQFDESIRILIDYYKTEMNKYDTSVSSKPLSMSDVFVPEEAVKEIYDELENTQNFGASIIFDKSKSDEYKVAPTSLIYEQPKEETKNILDTNVEKNSIVTPQNDIIKEQEDKQGVIEETETLTFQQKMYLENEQNLQANKAGDLQTDLGMKTKTLTLRSNASRRGNAAYISMSLLLYLIGSFELLLAIIMLVKYL